MEKFSNQYLCTLKIAVLRCRLGGVSVAYRLVSWTYENDCFLWFDQILYLLSEWFYDVLC